VKPSTGRTHAPAQLPDHRSEDPLITGQGERFAAQAPSAAAARLAGKDAQVRRLERAEPLQRQVLAALADGVSIPSELAARIGRPKESVTRELGRLRKGGLVTYRDVPGDARKRSYSLTASGEIQLSQHRAFGAATPPPDEPGNVEVAEFLAVALRAAIVLRRRTNKLDDVIVRLERVVTEARKADAHAVALEATTELVTTLRQAHRFERAREVLAEVERISHGLVPQAGTALVPAAIAHREYTLGLLATRERDRAIGVKHLVFASELYQQFAELPPYGTTAEWREREAWSLLGLANNLRAQSLFEQAMRASGQALRLFEELEDHYGQSRCLFTFGFSLRLLGDHSNAWLYLEDSHRLAAEHGFERFQADSLMQMGEVRRCQGQLDEALELLTESRERAKNLKFTVTQAFALSALGAVHYQCRDLQRSADAFEQAQRLFERNKHPEGAALNARRHATVARRLAHMDADRRAVAGLVADAFRRYSAIRCPAGVAAAEIEAGYLKITGRGDPNDVAARLSTLLAEPRQRVLIEYDFCVPRVLYSFAGHIDDEGTLVQRAAELVHAARRRAQEARIAIRETIAAIGTRSPVVEEEPLMAPEITSVDEMGGESRHFLAGVAAGEPVCF